MPRNAHQTPWGISASEFPHVGDPARILEFLLHYAVLAPSGHNTQPWLFRIRGPELELFADRARALPVVDPDDRELVISCGAALLNLRVALRRFGFDADAFETVPDRSDPDLLGRVWLRTGEPPSDDDMELFEAITRRRTTRFAYEEAQIPAELVDLMRKGAEREGAWLLFVEGDARLRVANLAAAGDRLQMRSKHFRRELAAWMHPNRSFSKRGMRGYGFGLGDLMSLGGPLAVRTFDMGEGQAAIDHELAEHAPLLAVLGSKGDTTRDWLAAGLAMERVLLRVCAAGYTASYLNQAAEVEEIRPRLAETVGRPNQHPQLVMRFGRAPEAPHTPRAPVQDVLLSS